MLLFSHSFPVALAALRGWEQKRPSFPGQGRAEAVGGPCRVHGLPVSPSPSLRVWAGDRAAGQGERAGRLKHSCQAPPLADVPSPPSPPTSPLSCGKGTSLSSPFLLSEPPAGQAPAPPGPLHGVFCPWDTHVPPPSGHSQAQIRPGPHNKLTCSSSER